MRSLGVSCLKILVLLVGTISLFSCGGGTTGTDNGSREVRSATILGSLADQSGAPIEGADLIIIETGESTTSDENGEFRIDSMPESETVHLQVISGEVQDSIPIGEIPEGMSQVIVALTLNEVDELVSVVSIEISSIEENDVEQRDGDSPEKPKEPVQQETGSIFSGTVRYRDQSPAGQVSIEVSSTHKLDVTNSNGDFWIETPIIQGEVRLIVEIAGLRDSVVIPNLPKKAVHVRLRLELSVEAPTTNNRIPKGRSAQPGSAIKPRLKARVLGLSMEGR